MWFPGGQHRVSKVDTMWFPQDTTGFPHGCHVVSIWTPCVVEATTWKPAQKTALHEANWLPCLTLILLLVKKTCQITYTNEGNQLTSIPGHIPQNVQILKLSNNKIRQLVESDIDQFRSLEEIYLTSNVIEIVDEDFLNPSIHSNLTVLPIKNNLIEMMPKLDGLESLKYLNLSQNKLHKVHFGQLGALKEMLIDDNKLSSMPNLTMEMPSLIRLILRKNNIAEVSIGYFAKLPALKELDLTSNLYR